MASGMSMTFNVRPAAGGGGGPGGKAAAAASSSPRGGFGLSLPANLECDPPRAAARADRPVPKSLTAAPLAAAAAASPSSPGARPAPSRLLLAAGGALLGPMLMLPLLM